MSYCEDLNQARRQLFESLGENTKKYCQLMKLWFSMKLTKEEFDFEARRMMNAEQTHLHNVFLLCLFNKCGGLSRATSKTKLKDFKKLKMNKAKRSSDKGAFQLADPVNYLPQLESPPQHLQDEPQRYCVQELFLPDHSLILGRLMLTSWEMGMEGAEENAAEILVHAVQDSEEYFPSVENFWKMEGFSNKETMKEWLGSYFTDAFNAFKLITSKVILRYQIRLTDVEDKRRFLASGKKVCVILQLEKNRLFRYSFLSISTHFVKYIARVYFLKNILTMIIAQRNGFKLRENRMIYSLGSPIPNPWLRNTQNIVDDSMYSKMTVVNEGDDENVHVPRIPLTIEEIERKEMYSIACANTPVQTPLKPPVSTYDVFRALQVHKSAIPSHSLYAINMDKIISAFNHPSHEEIEAARYFVNA